MDVFELGISMFLTIFVYLLVPVIYLLTEGKLSPKEAKIFALVNAIVCAIIFCIVRAVISGGKTIVSSFAPAILYYFIVKAMLTDKNKISTKNDKDKTEKSNKTNENTSESFKKVVDFYVKKQNEFNDKENKSNENYESKFSDDFYEDVGSENNEDDVVIVIDENGEIIEVIDKDDEKD